MVIEPQLPKTRRDVIATMGAAATAIFVSRDHFEVLADHPRTAHGRVVEQTSGPGSGALSQPGLANVMVSNGRDVTLTDSGGRWSLPARDGDSIFVIKPAHWGYTSTGGIPEFSYLHGPDARSQGHTFCLRRQPEPDAFDVLLVADTQAATAEELEYVRTEMGAATSLTRAAFAINHGDIMGDDLSLMKPYRALLEETGIVWHHCPGNHDMNLDATDPRLAFETWRRDIGPTHYAFQVGGATFIVLNNVAYLGRGARSADGRIYLGQIGKEQLQFVAGVLAHVAKDQLIVVSMHIPLVSFESPESVSDTTADRQELLRMLSEFPNAVSFAGHSHTTEHHYLGSNEGFARAAPHHHHVLTAFCGSWWSGPKDHRGIPKSDSRDGSPRGFHVLKIDRQSYATEFVPLGASEHPHVRASVQMDGSGARLTGVATMAATAASHAPPQLVVDVFDGGPKTSVVCEMDGVTQPIVLSRTRVADPYIVETFANHKSQLKAWVTPSPSSHIWTAPLAGSCTAGRRACQIRVTGEYGQERVIEMMV